MLVAPKFVEDEVGHLRVFGIAVRYKLKEAAMVAMRCTLRHSAVGRPYVKELDHVSARAYHQLLDYHWRCFQSIVSLGITTTNLLWVPLESDGLVPECKTCSVQNVSTNRRSHIQASKYWTRYLDGVKDVLRERPCRTSVLRPGLVDDALREASNCPHNRCSRGAVGTMRKLTKIFAKEIEEATSKVSPS